MQNTQNYWPLLKTKKATCILFVSLEYLAHHVLNFPKIQSHKFNLKAAVRCIQDTLLTVWQFIIWSYFYWDKRENCSFKHHLLLSWQPQSRFICRDSKPAEGPFLKGYLTWEEHEISLVLTCALCWPSIQTELPFCFTSFHQPDIVCRFGAH